MSLRNSIHRALHSSSSMLRHTLLISVPMSLILACLINLGVFDMISEVLQDFGSCFPVPPAGYAIIAAQFGSFIAGASVASTLLGAGTMAGQQIVITPLVGNILTSITRGIRFYGSSYAAIFGPRTGAEIQIISLGLRNIIIIIIVAILSFLWLS